MAPTLVSDIKPFPEEYEGDRRFHKVWIMVLTEPVPAGWWLRIGSDPDAEVGQVESCERADPYYICRMATRVAKPHAAGEPITVIGELTD